MEQEKKKLVHKSDGFQILEYIRASIEIIMNLKVEDLEREVTSKRHAISQREGKEVDDSLNSS